MPTLPVYATAVVAGLAGCFTFWVWLRFGKAPLWPVPIWFRWQPLSGW